MFDFGRQLPPNPGLLEAFGNDFIQMYRNLDKCNWDPTTTFFDGKNLLDLTIDDGTLRVRIISNPSNDVKFTLYFKSKSRRDFVFITAEYLSDRDSLRKLHKQISEQSWDIKKGKKRPQE